MSQSICTKLKFISEEVYWSLIQQYSTLDVPNKQYNCVKCPCVKKDLKKMEKSYSNSKY